MSLALLGNEPFVVLDSVDVVNDDNGNGQLDPGETAGIETFIRNIGTQTATNVQGTLRTASSYITITDSTYSYGTLAPGAGANNVGDPYDVIVSPSTPAGTIIDFQLVLACTEDTWIRPFSLQVGIQPGKIIWGPKLLPLFPSTGFIYGVAYHENGNRIYVLDGYSRTIRAYSADSNLTYAGAYTAPDTNCSDISWCNYDGNFWVTSWNLKQIWKITATGAVLRNFPNPANDYPVGLAYNDYTLWCADRRTTLGGAQYIYVSDTLGNATQYLSPVQGYYNSRCLAYDRIGNTYVQAQTWFNSAGSALDSAGVVEYAGVPPVATGNRFKVPTGWNIRGIEVDPRDGNFWITIPQGASSYNMIVKVKGFNEPAVGVKEDETIVANDHQLIVSPIPAQRELLINFNLKAYTAVSCRIFDTAGRLVRIIMDNEILDSGKHLVRWNLRDDHARSVADGVYIVVLESDNQRSSNKIVVTR